MTPYIKPEQRPALDGFLEPLILEIVGSNPARRDGEVNYVITRLLHALYRESYFDMNAALGVLEAAKLEFYRRRVAPYEDKKVRENGDVL